MNLLNITVFLIGLLIVGFTMYSAVRTFVLPRSVADPVPDLVFRFTRKFFDFRLRFGDTYETRDRILALFAPVSLILLLPTWLGLASIGYTALFWASGIDTIFESWIIAGSSLLTLGFASGDTPLQILLSFSAATLGLILVALMIAYLPTMYSAFAKREVTVTLLAAGAGAPPSPIELLLRYNRVHGLEELSKLWETWENWFAEVEESHTSLSALVFFRSPLPEHSWVAAAGTVLDAAALLLGAMELPQSPQEQAEYKKLHFLNNPQAALCIRMGYLALRRISDFFDIKYNPAPHFPEQPISITRQEFETALDQLEQGGLPIMQDRDAAWQNYGGWRVNYDTVLLALAQITDAPSAMWSSDRAPVPPIQTSK